MLAAAVIIMVGVPAVVIDSRSSRIPNALVAVALIAALAVQLWAGGTAGIKSALLGFLVGMAFLLPLHVSGAMGAGDVKLMAAFGTLLGPYGALMAGTATLLAGALLALITLGRHRRATVGAGAIDSGAIRMPYAAAIVCGALAATLMTA